MGRHNSSGIFFEKMYFVVLYTYINCLEKYPKKCTQYGSNRHEKIAVKLLLCQRYGNIKIKKLDSVFEKKMIPQVLHTMIAKKIIWPNDRRRASCIFATVTTKYQRRKYSVVPHKK